MDKTAYQISQIGSIQSVGSDPLHYSKVFFRSLKLVRNKICQFDSPEFGVGQSVAPLSRSSHGSEVTSRLRRLGPSDAALPPVEGPRLRFQILQLARRRFLGETLR